jgi:adhesin HecA-like repeat protein
MNSLDGRIKANAAIVPAGGNGAVSVYVHDTSNVVLDIDGYFVPTGASTLQFYSLPPCRVVDTRNADGPLAGPFLNGDRERDFPVLESSCIPEGVNAQAYSFNVTAVPHPAGQRLGFLTIWPQGQLQPTVSTLNNTTGTIVANAAIVPAGTAGGVAVYPNNNTDLLIDINGYFAAPGTDGLSLYTITPCRVLDTRNGNGAFSGELSVPVEDSACSPAATAQAYVLNATVVPQPSLGFLTLWANGQPQPAVSTLNAKDGAISSNMAIVLTTNGSIDAYANNLTQLILDISSYFAP